ncbi:MAG: aldo/keto reductase [Armatimonadota bacterium]
MEKKLSWGIIGSGNIAKVLAHALAASSTSELIAIGSRTQEAADIFGDEFDVSRRYGSYEKLLADPDVQAVYISTPHPLHAEWAVKAADAGKHILCEKPLTLDYAQAMAVFEAARRNNVFIMEAFMYRCHPQTARLVELIREGAIGKVGIIQCAFSFNAGFNLDGRLLNPNLGGGGILDVGCYCTSMSRLIAGAALGRDYAEPIGVKAFGLVGNQSHVDEYTAALLQFPGDIIAQIATGVRLNQDNSLRIYGSDGNITVPLPWFPGRNAEPSKITLNRAGKETEEIVIEVPADLYTLEVDTVANAVNAGELMADPMPWGDTLGNMQTLDRWREEIGLFYPIELADAVFPVIDGKQLTVRAGNRMKYGEIAGICKPVSRMVMGVMLPGGQMFMPSTSMLFDEFFASGGNCFDTAHIYGGGLSEQTLGKWIRNRDIREQVVVLDKGAHTPWCNPEDLTKQLLESLDRLGSDYIDLYIMHRDNLDIPVGEFVDVLNEHKNAGRIHAFGGSNWTIERVEAANEYAKRKGLTGFSAISNNFSLARMVEPVWGGCISSSDPESRAWFQKTKMPLMAWSSLARGFFVNGDPKNLSDGSMVQSWYSDDNFKRQERIKKMSAERSIPIMGIAMAYVLCQPMELYALFGPATIDEMRISLQALDIVLSPEDMKWLNLEI